MIGMPWGSTSRQAALGWGCVRPADVSARRAVRISRSRSSSAGGKKRRKKPWPRLGQGEGAWPAGVAQALRALRVSVSLNGADWLLAGGPKPMGLIRCRLLTRLPHSSRPRALANSLPEQCFAAHRAPVPTCDEEWWLGGVCRLRAAAHLHMTHTGRLGSWWLGAGPSRQPVLHAETDPAKPSPCRTHLLHAGPGGGPGGLPHRGHVPPLAVQGPNHKAPHQRRLGECRRGAVCQGASPGGGGHGVWRSAGGR